MKRCLLFLCEAFETSKQSNSSDRPYLSLFQENAFDKRKQILYLTAHSVLRGQNIVWTMICVYKRNSLIWK